MGVFSLVLLATIFTSLPSNVAYPRSVDDPFRVNVTTLMPQSWPFFTKPPSDPEFTSYEVSDQKITSVSKFPNNKSDNFYGITRTQRAQGPELANLSFQVPTEDWVDCSEHPSEVCLEVAASTEQVPTSNESPNPSLCGNILLVETEPVDFVNRDSYEGWRIDSRVAYMRVTC